MKKLKLLFGFLAVSLLVGIVMYSCQSDGNDAYYFEEEELTAADLFVASEAYQNLKRELKKEKLQRDAAVSKLTEIQLNEYRNLVSIIMDSENFSEIIQAGEKLSTLLGFDQREVIINRARKVENFLSDQVFSRLEFIKAIQRYQMNFTLISTRQTIAEMYDECCDKCYDDNLKAEYDCNQAYPTPRTKTAQEAWEACNWKAYYAEEECNAKCKMTYYPDKN